MHHVQQTVLTPPTDALRACLASILELPLKAVPEVPANLATGGALWPSYDRWLAERNLALLWIQEDGTPRPAGLSLGIVPSRRHPFPEHAHFVVVRDGQIVFDPDPEPNPDARLLLRGLFTVLDASRAVDMPR